MYKINIAVQLCKVSDDVRKRDALEVEPKVPEITKQSKLKHRRSGLKNGSKNIEN